MAEENDGDLSRVLAELADMLQSDQETLSGGGAEKNQLISRFQGLVKRLLETHFTDYAGNESPHNHNHNMEAIICFLQQLCSSSPVVFCEGSIPMGGFLVGKVLPFFGKPHLSRLHPSLLNVLTDVLNLLHQREPSSVRFFAMDALLLLQDLMLVWRYFSTNDKAANNRHRSISLRCFVRFCEGSPNGSDADAAMTPLSCGVSSSESCSSFQCCMTQAVTLLLQVLPCFLSNCYQPFWSILEQQIVYGSLQLQITSLNSLRLLIIHLGLPCSVQPQLVSLFASFLAKLPSFNYRSAELEDAFGSCLLLLLKTAQACAVRPFVHTFLHAVPQLLGAANSTSFKAMMYQVFVLLLQHKPSNIDQILCKFIPFLSSSDIHLRILLARCLAAGLTCSQKASRNLQSCTPGLDLGKKRKRELNCASHQLSDWQLVQSNGQEFSGLEAIVMNILPFADRFLKHLLELSDGLKLGHLPASAFFYHDPNIHGSSPVEEVGRKPKMQFIAEGRATKDLTGATLADRLFSWDTIIRTLLKFSSLDDTTWGQLFSLLQSSLKLALCVMGEDKESPENKSSCLGTILALIKKLLVCKGVGSFLRSNTPLVQTVLEVCLIPFSSPCLCRNGCFLDDGRANSMALSAAQALCYFPTEIAVEERRKAFSEALSHSCAVVKHGAVVFLPLFLQRVPFVPVCEFLPALHKLLHHPSTPLRLISSIHTTVGYLACVDCGCAWSPQRRKRRLPIWSQQIPTTRSEQELPLPWDGQVDTRSNTKVTTHLSSSSLLCNLCTKPDGEGEEEVHGPKKEDPGVYCHDGEQKTRSRKARLVDWLPFLSDPVNLAGATDENHTATLTSFLRESLPKLLCHIVHHYGCGESSSLLTTTADKLSKYVALIHHTNSHVREAVAQAIPFLIQQQRPEQKGFSSLRGAKDLLAKENEAASSSSSSSSLLGCLFPFPEDFSLRYIFTELKNALSKADEIRAVGEEGREDEEGPTNQNTTPLFLHETVLLTFGQIGAVVTNKFLMLALVTLLKRLVDCDPAIRAFAYDQLQYISTHKGLSTDRLLDQFKEEIYPMLVESLLHNNDAMMMTTEGAAPLAAPKQQEEDHHSLLLLDQVSSAIYDVDSALFLKQTLAFALPRIVAQGNHKLFRLVVHRLHGSTCKEILLEEMHHVFQHLLLNERTEQLEAGISFISEYLPSTPSLLIKTCINKLLNRLVLLLPDPALQDQVKSAMLVARDIMFSESEPDPMTYISKGIGTTGVTEDPVAARNNHNNTLLADFLSTFFLSIMDYLSNIFLNTGPPLLSQHHHHHCHQQQMQQQDWATAKKANALQSLEVLIQLIGPHVNPFHPKVMATLKLVLRYPQLAQQACKVWNTFITGLDISQVGPILNQIVVDLLPYLQLPECMPQVQALLRYLIVEHKPSLKPYFKEIPFLPNVPALAEICEVLESEQKVSEGDWRAQLRHMIEGLSHESEDVRLLALDKVYHLLCTRREEIREGTLQGERVDPVLCSLLKCLITIGSGSTRLGLKAKAGQCLGELGAIDPGRLDLALMKPACLPCLDKDDNDLAFELINDYLVPVFRAANHTRKQDRAAFAIQKLLKFCGCSHPDVLQLLPSTSATTLESATSVGVDTAGAGAREATASNKRNASPRRKTGASQKSRQGQSSSPRAQRGLAIWQRFKEDVREIIRPCLTSRYKLQPSNAQCPTPVHAHASDFQTWLANWVGNMIPHTQGKQAKIFAACCGVVKKDDPNTAHFLLPYIILNILRAGSEEDQRAVREEVLCVLKASVSPLPADSGPPLSQQQQRDYAEEEEQGQRGYVGESEPRMEESNEMSGYSQMSTQMIFELLDMLAKWTEVQKQQGSRSRGSSSRTTRQSTAATSITVAGGEDELSVMHVERLLKSIPQLVLAKAAYRCKAYPRALLHLEQHLRHEIDTAGALSRQDLLAQNVAFMQKVYCGIDEPDGLKGIAQLRPSTSLHERILDLQNVGDWTEALICYDQVLQQQSRTTPSDRVGHLRCLRKLGQLETMLSLARNYLDEESKLNQLDSHARSHQHGLHRRSSLLSYAVRAAWRLCKWDTLQEFLVSAGECRPHSEHHLELTESRHSQPDYEVSLGNILLALHNTKDGQFHKAIEQARVELMDPLSAAAKESYQKAYPILTKLHVLKEIEQCYTLLKESPQIDSAKAELLQDWELRLKVTQPSFKTREPILTLRRVLFEICGLTNEACDCWLRIAKVARSAKHYQTAYSAILHASQVPSLNLHLEKAKLMWAQGNYHEALAHIQRELAGYPLDSSTSSSDGSVSSLVSSVGKIGKVEDFPHAKTLLLLGKWAEETGQSSSEEVIKQYEKVKQMQGNWEKGFFFLGKYYDTLLRQNAQEPASQAQQADVLAHILANYGGSLIHGHQYIFRSLPRLLTLWLDYGAQCSLAANAEGKAEKKPVRRGRSSSSSRAAKDAKGLARTNTIMAKLMEQIPTYAWYTCFSQLISRICHPHPDVYALLEKLILKILVTYPRQATWPMIALHHSYHSVRKARAVAIFNKAKEAGYNDLLTNAEALCEQLLVLSDYQAPKTTTTLSINRTFRKLQRMLPQELIVPLQHQLVATLPAGGKVDRNHKPFADSPVTMDSFQDKVEIMSSLQRPKKITVTGNDGCNYLFLCKPKDDLRKDNRMMEFNSMINKLLMKTPQSRRRNLWIRTYAVVPLNEECGLIEWVPNTLGLRPILNSIYNQLGLLPGNKQIRDIWNRRGQTAQERYKDGVLPLFPPVFHRWYLERFPEPSAWFEARLAYARSIAVMSMVGYVVGLGDRHGENILFDSQTGECVHVDFNCLFWKGQQFEKPEKVPFRLTPNMTDALGLTKHEGIFRAICEITLRVLRTNRETLMSVLETFIYDPLVEWSSRSKHGSTGGAPGKEGGEVDNPDGLRTISNIDRRLKGLEKPGLPLSIEGQVHQQINEAISIDNLSQMYIGWAPWL